MKFPKRLLAWMLSVVMVFGLTGTLAFANETETDPNYNHGTIAVKADDSNGTITMVKGGTAEITVSPYVHVQYQGCQMPDCPEICGGKDCFTLTAETAGEAKITVKASLCDWVSTT